MGGFGDGRRGGGPTVEGSDALVLGAGEVVRPLAEAARRRGLLPGRAGEGRLLVGTSTWRWTRAGAAGPWAAVEVRLELGPWDGLVWFRHAARHPSPRAAGPQHYTVALVATPCRFGGVRWWWLCPATGRRVAKLYLPDGAARFLSRGPGCHGLAYASQRVGRIERGHRRAGRLRARLGDHQGRAFGPLPPRPARMRRATYERLLGRLAAVEDRLMDEVVAAGARLLARLAR
jgi:hypothetical protein